MYVVHERLEKKRMMFRTILVNSMSQKDIDYDKTEKYLRLLENLREGHLLFLRLLADPGTFDTEVGGIIGMGGRMSTSYSQIFHKLLPQWDLRGNT